MIKGARERWLQNINKDPRTLTCLTCSWWMLVVLLGGSEPFWAILTLPCQQLPYEALLGQPRVPPQLLG